MQSRSEQYRFQDSLSRIDEILKAADANYTDAERIPPRYSLTFSNGFYVNCFALFIDIRESSSLPGRFRRPTLAKIYRAFISECVAIINGNESCAEVNIHGDAVWGVFGTTVPRSADSVFETAGRLHSFIQVLNCRLNQSGMQGISAGIAVTHGPTLMIKAGHRLSALSEVVWMGDVVNQASKLANAAAQGGNLPILVSQAVYSQLCAVYQGYLKPNTRENCYHCGVVNKEMDEWREEFCP
jgi:class 3 adenylate cyclase